MRRLVLTLSAVLLLGGPARAQGPSCSVSVPSDVYVGRSATVSVSGCAPGDSFVFSFLGVSYNGQTGVTGSGSVSFTPQSGAGQSHPWELRFGSGFQRGGAIFVHEAQPEPSQRPTPAPTAPPTSANLTPAPTSSAAPGRSAAPAARASQRPRSTARTSGASTSGGATAAPTPSAGASPKPDDDVRASAAPLAPLTTSGGSSESTGPWLVLIAVGGVIFAAGAGSLLRGRRHPYQPPVAAPPPEQLEPATPLTPSGETDWEAIWLEEIETGVVSDVGSRFGPRRSE